MPERRQKPPRLAHDGSYLPPWKLRLSTIAPRELSEYKGVPIFPPLRLPACGSAIVWWHIEGGELSYRHASSTLTGARRELLQTLIDECLRRIARSVMNEPLAAVESLLGELDPPDF